jgi:hypothetical protein
MATEFEVLQGGVANVGAVVRVGNEVLRPAPANHATIHRFLRHLGGSGASIASEPIGLADDERERLRFVPGDVPIPPYPAWAQSELVLASIAGLMRSMHEASRDFKQRSDDVWCVDGLDPESDGSVICHNDVCLENVVFRNGEAVALLDFDFAAPGRRSYDVACFARMCVPVDYEMNRRRLGWDVTNLPERMRLIADSYGSKSTERAEIITSIDYLLVHHAEFVRQRVEAGDPGFVAQWESSGGRAHFDRRQEWWTKHRGDFVAAML